MVVRRRDSSFEESVFSDLMHFLCKGDLLVLNDTRVLTCRLIGYKATGGKVEVLLTRRKSGTAFEAMIQPSRTKTGEKISFGAGKVAGIITGRKEISFRQEDAEGIYSLGVVPLPPYIKRESEEDDKEYYQTVYADKEGAIASPTAGLHFTEELLRSISSAGVNIARITLHVGVGTFKPVTSDDITQHRMDEEYFKVPAEAQEKIRQAKSGGKRIIAVGTTSLRALETYAAGSCEGHTNLFIYPGCRFKLVDCLLTNFHLPKTTLFMLVCAFAGTKLMQEAYRKAVDDKFRFYSYGDAMLII